MGNLMVGALSFGKASVGYVEIVVVSVTRFNVTLRMNEPSETLAQHI